MNSSVFSLARFWRCESGVNAIEFAFVVPIVIAILLATLQVGVIFLAQAYLEYVAEDGARKVLTNEAKNNNWNQSQFAAQICANVQALFNCDNLIVSEGFGVICVFSPKSSTSSSGVTLTRQKLV